MRKTRVFWRFFAIFQTEDPSSGLLRVLYALKSPYFQQIAGHARKLLW